MMAPKMPGSPLLTGSSPDLAPLHADRAQQADLAGALEYESMSVFTIR